MASSPHKIRFISIPGKETSPVLLMTREKSSTYHESFTRLPFLSFLRASTSKTSSFVRSIYGQGLSILTLRGPRIFEPAFYGQHFLEEGFKPPPSSQRAVAEAGDHNVGSQEPWMFRGKLSLLYRSYIFIAMYLVLGVRGRLGNVNPILASSV